MRLFVMICVLLLMVVPVAAQDNVLTLITHDSFNVSENVIAAFEAESGFTVQILRRGDTGTMVNESILTANNPLGDVMFGIDNTFLSRGLNADLFIPYGAPALADIPAEFRLDDQFRVTPIDYGDVCLNYDVAYFAESDLDLPETLADLADPAYSGLLTVQNPATSSPGLAFLLATIEAFGEEGEYSYLDFWTDLVANDVYISDDWTDAYYGQFSGSGGSDGTRPLVVSYASSPPAEVIFAETELTAAPTGSIIAPGTCFRQIEFAGILRGTNNLEAAQQFIDFLLSVEFQEDVPLQMFVFPVNPDAELPPEFVDYAVQPDEPVVFDIAAIEANRERWIQEWTETVLR